MQVKNIITKLVVFAAIALPCSLSAQTSSINAFSPYTMYGIGDLATQGALPTRSMGGVGIGMRSAGVVNMLNPAAMSARANQSFLFNFGLEGQNYYNSQVIAGQEKSTAYNTFNFHDIAFQIPVAKKLGFGFSLTPYSSVGYRIQADDINGEYGWANYLYEGEGDITEVKFSFGYELFKNFSIGAAMQYYWGDIDRKYSVYPTNIVDNGAVLNTSGHDNYSVSKMKGQFGMQWSPISTKKRILTIGATYDIGGDLQPDLEKSITIGDIFGSVVSSEVTDLEMVLPQQVATGVYYQINKISVGFDYVYQNWGSGNSSKVSTKSGYEVAYQNTSTFKMGVEYTPDRYDIRSYFNRWTFRAGGRYGSFNQTFNGISLSEYAITAGVGVPIKFMGLSAIDVGVEYGVRGGGSVAERAGLVKQQHFKVALGFSLFAGASEGWFVRRKFD